VADVVVEPPVPVFVEATAVVEFDDPVAGVLATDPSKLGKSDCKLLKDETETGDVPTAVEFDPFTPVVGDTVPEFEAVDAVVAAVEALF